MWVCERETTKWQTCTHFDVTSFLTTSLSAFPHGLRSGGPVNTQLTWCSDWRKGEDDFLLTPQTCVAWKTALGVLWGLQGKAGIGRNYGMVAIPYVEGTVWFKPLIFNWLIHDFCCDSCFLYLCDFILILGRSQVPLQTELLKKDKKHCCLKPCRSHCQLVEENLT